MPRFGKLSTLRLASCHNDIKLVMYDAIQYFDFTILCGTRSKTEQMELFKQGRVKENGQWKKVGKTVTNIDGLSKMSKHNYTPSLAIDIAPYPIDWDNIERFKELSEVIKASCERVGVKLQWGGDWEMRDYPHWEIKQ